MKGEYELQKEIDEGLLRIEEEKNYLVSVAFRKYLHNLIDTVDISIDTSLSVNYAFLMIDDEDARGQLSLFHRKRLTPSEHKVGAQASPCNGDERCSLD